MLSLVFAFGKRPSSTHLSLLTLWKSWDTSEGVTDSIPGYPGGALPQMEEKG